MKFRYLVEAALFAALQKSRLKWIGSSLTAKERAKRKKKRKIALKSKRINRRKRK